MATKAAPRVPHTPSPLYVYDNKELGEGSFGVVVRVAHRQTGQKFAQKAILLQQRAKYRREHMKQVLREIMMLNRLQHENVMKLYDAFYDSGCVYLMLEYMPLTLRHLINSVSTLSLTIIQHTYIAPLSGPLTSTPPPGHGPLFACLNCLPSNVCLSQLTRQSS